MSAFDTTTATRAIPGSIQRFGSWLREGWALFLRAPLRLFALLLAMLLVEGIVQLTVPTIGMLASKWIVAMMAGVIWLMLSNLAQQGCLQPVQAIGRVRGKWLALAVLSFVQLGAFAVQVAVAWMILGPAGRDMLLLLAMPAEISLLNLGLILAAGIPINTLLLFAMPRLLLDRQTLPTALTEGIRTVWRHIRPLALMTLVMIILVGLAPATFLLSVLLTGPLMFCVGFAAYRDVGRAR